MLRSTASPLCSNLFLSSIFTRNQMFASIKNLEVLHYAIYRRHFLKLFLNSSFFEKFLVEQSKFVRNLEKNLFSTLKRILLGIFWHCKIYEFLTIVSFCIIKTTTFLSLSMASTWTVRCLFYIKISKTWFFFLEKMMHFTFEDSFAL